MIADRDLEALIFLTYVSTNASKTATTIIKATSAKMNALLVSAVLSQTNRPKVTKPLASAIKDNLVRAFMFLTQI